MKYKHGLEENSPFSFVKGWFAVEAKGNVLFVGLGINTNLKVQENRIPPTNCILPNPTIFLSFAKK